uniref:Proheparin-binding EGF-like growth factor n=1 Tax=Oncorhynchus mykiss TaxID=8022 RepID=A0A8K9UYU2_ONCMY
MNIYLRFAIFIVYGSVSFRISSGNSANTIDRHGDKSPVQLAVVSLLHNDKEIRDNQLEYDEEEYYYEHGDEDYLSGDYEMQFPKVAFSTKPKDLPVAPYTVRTREGKRKGKGKKRNPCLRKYKDYCIHGVCQYLRELREPSCICLLGYSGERCHLFTLPVTKEAEGYNRTIALAVVAVVVSFLCLTVIAILMAIRSVCLRACFSVFWKGLRCFRITNLPLSCPQITRIVFLLCHIRYHKQGQYNLENEEKVKLEAVAYP